MRNGISKIHSKSWISSFISRKTDNRKYSDGGEEEEIPCGEEEGEGEGQGQEQSKGKE